MAQSVISRQRSIWSLWGIADIDVCAGRTRFMGFAPIFQPPQTGFNAANAGAPYASAPANHAHQRPFPNSCLFRQRRPLAPSTSCANQKSPLRHGHSRLILAAEALGNASTAWVVWLRHLRAAFRAAHGEQCAAPRAAHGDQLAVRDGAAYPTSRRSALGRWSVRAGAGAWASASDPVSNVTGTARPNAAVSPKRENASRREIISTLIFSVISNSRVRPSTPRLSKLETPERPLNKIR